MAAIARVGVDNAGGGIILGPGAPTVRANGSVVAVLGDLIAPHGLSPHDFATIIVASTTVKGNSKRIARKGDLCSCGHSIATGSSNVNAGG